MSDQVQNDNAEERPRGDRGSVGQPTAALTVKQMYHTAFFKRVDAEDKQNPNKKVWVKSEGAPSLKQFARQMLAKGDATTKDWFAHKHGSMNAKRSETNIALAKTTAQATKAERHKRSSGKANKK